MLSLIGIVPRTLMAENLYKIQVNYEYLEPFVERKISTIILPLIDTNLEHLLSLCDGFLIIGGDDIDPTNYGEESIGHSKNVDAAVDRIDKMVIEHAVANKKPLLGICRGLQSINIFLGGNLYQDINYYKLQHEVKEDSHLVTTLYNHPIAERFEQTFVVNSHHHQAIKDLAKGFIPIFKADDVIEGIIHQELPILGVQWHPEKLNTKSTKIIFDYFVTEVKNIKNNKNGV